MTNPTEPSLLLLIKLGSAVRHADEMLDPIKGHVFDLGTFKALLADPEITEWMAQMDKLGLLPVKR